MPEIFEGSHCVGDPCEKVWQSVDLYVGEPAGRVGEELPEKVEIQKMGKQL